MQLGELAADVYIIDGEYFRMSLEIASICRRAGNGRDRKLETGQR